MENREMERERERERERQQNVRVVTGRERQSLNCKSKLFGKQGNGETAERVCCDSGGKYRV